MADRRPPGRPPLQRGDPSASVHTRLTGRDFDAVCERAAAQGLSVSAWTRQAIARQIRRAGAADDEEDDE